MKNFIKLFFTGMLLWVSTNQAFTQPTERQRIEDSVIGWKTVYNFKGKQYKPLVIDGQTFSPYQQSIRDTFITWMQRTYKPIGGFGDIYQKYFSLQKGNFPVPQDAGMVAGIYGLYKNSRTGKYELIANENHDDVFIYINNLSGISNAALLSSQDGYYFTMAKRNYASTFTDQEVINAAKDFGLHSDSRFSKYMVYFPSQSSVTVVLIPGNKLPIVQLTKGEVLALCEKGLQRELEEKKKEARHMSSNNPSYYADVIKDLDEKQYPLCIKNLNQLKEKYKDKLNEPAVLYGWAGPSFADFVNNNTTLFVEDWYQNIDGYPVYRYTKEAIENSKKDKPLWVAISWKPEKPGSNIKPYEVHKAMLRYFNFDYVYDYFFNPEKVKGIAYTPSNAEEQKEKIQGLRKHYAVAETKPLPQGIFFMDDFSANTNGDRPAGWSDSKSKPALVVNLKDKAGKWLQLGHSDLSPWLKNSLPENFTMEFDVATDEFEARAGGAVKLSFSSYPINAEGSVVSNSKGTILEWQLLAGNEADYNNNNYSGESESVINSTVAGYEGKYNTVYAPREFTNKKRVIHATVKVNKGQASFFINGKEIAASNKFKKDYCNDCVCKGIPPNTVFRKITFTNLTISRTVDGKMPNVYISNIKITKE